MMAHKHGTQSNHWVWGEKKQTPSEYAKGNLGILEHRKEVKR